METDLQNQDTPEYREMQEMIANNQRELDAKTQRLSQERLDFLRTQGRENWAGAGTPQVMRTNEEIRTGRQIKSVAAGAQIASSKLLARGQ